MEKFAQFIIERAKLIIALIIISTALLGYQIRFIQVNSDVIDSLPDNDPNAVLLKQIGEKFGGNRIGIIILQAENIYTQESLQHIIQITDSISEMNSIQSVTSLSNIMEIRGGEYGIDVGTMIDPYNIPSTSDQLENLKTKVLANEMFSFLSSEDGTASTILFSLEQNADIHEVANNVKAMIEGMELPEEIYYSGNPMLVSSISSMISADMAKLIPVTFIVIGLVLFFGFRSLTGVILPLLVAAIAIVWTIGIMSIGGFEMSMVSSNIPILLLAVGSAYSIHVVNRILIERKTQEIKSAIKIALGYIFIPVLLSAITTSAGFASFTFGAYLNMILDYGLFTALGTLISCFLSLTFVPALLSLVKSQDSTPNKENRQKPLLGSFLKVLERSLFHKPMLILGSWMVLVAIGIGGVFLIKREIDVKEYFKKGNPTRIAEEIMTEKFGGTKPVFVLINGDIQDPEILQTMLDIEDYMKKSPDIKSTQSIADLIVNLNNALGMSEGLPEDKAVVEQLWFLIDGNEFTNRLVTEDLDQAIIISTFLSPDNQSKIAFSNYMTSYLETIESDNIEIQITGMPFVDVTMDESLVKSQIGSLAIAVVFVIIIVSLILKSLKSGFQASAPIIATIIILFGMMGFAGIPLNIGTVLVASVALGIGIDYSIHVINHFNHSLKKGTEVKDALSEAIQISGNAIVLNVLSVSTGFLVLLISEMVPLQYFGMLVAISMLGSGLGALTLLPVILILSHKNRIKVTNSLKNE
ncbi:MAG: RND family transporter [Reichenbachiella sp.]